VKGRILVDGDGGAGDRIGHAPVPPPLATVAMVMPALWIDVASAE
jgi:hypothetical protein